MTRAISSTSAVILVSILVATSSAVAQSAPDNENGRYALSPISDGVVRLDTRTGAVSTCNNAGSGWACYAVPDSAPPMMRKSAGCRRRTKSPKRNCKN